MVGTSGQAEIRGIDVDKLVKGYRPTAIQWINYVAKAKVTATEFRWYQKTPGFVNPATTTTITSNLGSNISFGTLPPIAEQSFTRQTGYVKKFMLETPWISEEDIASSDVSVLATNITDLVDSVNQMVNIRIWDVISNNRNTSGINSNACSAAWTTSGFTGVTMVKDVMTAKENLRAYGYNTDKNCVLALNSVSYRRLIEWLVEVKGADVVNWSSTIAEEGKVVEFCGCEVLVDTNVTPGYGLVFMKNHSATWREFKPITAVVISEPLVGKKVRVAIEGEATLDYPYSVNLITNM
jgi:hypothetical protein